ncbi:protein byr4 [Echria macrotheca]|uniref:Protein byr4 n=1 Tax=Echria macrotheca TaxID=438768 RepID=A0AAJ0BMR7_9PEZI|nr:protein byr4 [Echria macrotheca]
MDTLRLKPRQPAPADDIENWDDDDFLIDGDDLTVISQATSANVPSHRRDSHSSLRSDFESVTGEEEKQVLLPGDDEKSTLDAIAAAAKAGIPIPKNVPPSALMGGTIKRLGGRKIKKIIQEDWVDDLEIPDGKSLQIKRQDSSQFPEVLRQVSNSAFPSPPRQTKPSPSSPQQERKESRPIVPAGLINLDQFRDSEDDDFFGDPIATIKVTKRREIVKPIPMITPPTPQKKAGGDDDFETDFELPSDGKLRLSTRREIPKTPSLHTLDDLDWAEGSLGTRFGGTRRDARSNRSSSASALSPSIASSITAESEDETFDGLILPHGPLDFERRLNRHRHSRSPERIIEEPSREEKEERVDKADKGDKEDFLAGLDIGDGEVFDSKKLTLHRNIQLKEARPASPSRPKTSVVLKFTNKPAAVTSRLPRPMGPPMVSHERTHTQSSLEPVSESGGPITHTRRSLSRLGHSSQSSITSVATPTTPSSGYSIPPSTPRRKEIGQKTSTVSLRNEPTTTNTQLLRFKRSLPVMRGPQSPARPVTTTRGLERPPSRTEMAPRPPSSMRPKTPVERMRSSESAAAQARKPPVPFLPAGASASQSHNIVAKTSRVFRRHDSENSIEFRPNSRAVSRSTVRSPSPRKYRPTDKMAPEGAWHQLHKPRRMRNFGDGHELDGFDDLPTSSQAEARYLRQPVGAGPPKAQQLRNRLYQNVLPDRTTTPSPIYSPRVDYVPSFARDTAASRIARETILAQRVPSGVIAPLTAQRVAQLSNRNSYGHDIQAAPSAIKPKVKKSRRTPQLKPHLIANLNPPKDSKVVKGMCYNPVTFRWEGNDNVLSAFDAPASSPSTASVPQHMIRERENATPRPALITNIGTTKGVQVVGGMVFDPQNMCWIKMAPKTEQSDPMDGFNAIDDDEDVFKDIPDLEDHTARSSEGHGHASDIKDDWLVGEEFDVGPEFIRRQREEEERWRKKCGFWVGGPRDHGDAWKWAIRDIVSQTD